MKPTDVRDPEERHAQLDRPGRLDEAVAEPLSSLPHHELCPGAADLDARRQQLT